MSENLLRHLLALAGTLICGLAWVAGYVSGLHAWWWTILAVVLVYMIIFRLLSSGGHH